LLCNDNRSYLNVDDGWDPSKGVKLVNGDPIVTIRDFFAFATSPPDRPQPRPGVSPVRGAGRH
jgi:hypothetical protein